MSDLIFADEFLGVEMSNDSRLYVVISDVLCVTFYVLEMNHNRFRLLVPTIILD